MTEVTKEMLPDAICRAVNRDAAQGIKAAKERGQEIIDLSQAERERWVAPAKNSWDNWAKEMEAKGLPGRAVLDEAIKLVEKHKDYGRNN